MFIGCLWQAGRVGRHRVLELLWAALYGFLLEWLTIKQLHAYQYGQFLVMFDGAPLCVALSWAMIIYSSMEFSDQIQMPETGRAILDALMALNVDATLDTIAIRLGMWTWRGVDRDQQWFGVPWVNFWAWFIVVWTFSGFIRALRPWQHHRLRQWLYAPCAVVLSLLMLLVTSEVYRFMAENGGGALAVALLVGGSLAIILNLHPYVLRGEPLNLTVVAVPLLFHVFGIAAGIGYGIFAYQPVLGVIAILMLIVGVSVHMWPWWYGKKRVSANG
jgi:hypothetical protein